VSYCWGMRTSIALMADVAVFGADSGGAPHVLLVRRANDPFRGLAALPGGFVDEGEELEQAAARELAEETGLTLGPDRLHQVGAFGRIGRDPRGRSVSVCFWASVEGLPEVVAATDAAECLWRRIGNPQEEPLAFDHGELVEKAVASAASAYPRAREVLEPKGVESRQLKGLKGVPDGSVFTAPASDSPVPLVVVSPGFLATAAGYGRLARTLAGAGLAVLAVEHRDAAALRTLPLQLLSRRPLDPRLRRLIERADQVRSALDSLEEIEKAASVTIDRARVGLAGHSMGALVALALTGAAVKGATVADERIRAACFMACPPPLSTGLFVEGSFERVTVPVMEIVGGRDRIAIPRSSPSPSHEGPLALVASRPGYRLLLHDVGHMLGGILETPLPLPGDDPLARWVVARACAAFFCAGLRQEGHAALWLSAGIPPFGDIAPVEFQSRL
jgi:8-oxo-dGTP diphosphatase